MSDPKKNDIKELHEAKFFRERGVKITCSKVTAEQIQNGILTLEKFDVFYMLGGYAPNYYNALGDLGHVMVQCFVMQAGGYVGICAGAYYGAGRSNCGIRLIDVDVFDIENWNRGLSHQC